jgi:hypothetical protein
MPQASYTEHGDKITGLRRCISQCVKRRDPRAQQRAAAADDSSLGIDISPLAFAIITSAYPPS